VIAAAPIVADAAQPTAAPATAVASPTGTPAFDAILMLQNLAATAETAALEASETTDLIGADDSSDDEDNGDELEASLAFLAELLVVASPKGSAQEFQGGASQEQAGEESSPPVAAKSGGGEFLEAAEALLRQSDTGKSAEASALTPVMPEALEARASGGEATQGLARAAEILAASPRSAPVAHDKHSLATHVRDPRWADELGTRLSLMVRAGESTASLQLTPVDLGPVEVNVTVRESQATIHFGAAQAETRALLEASLPRLRELLAAQGYQLMDSSVSSGFARSHRQEGAQGVRPEGEAETSTTEARLVRMVGLVDIYA
jgi:flagellar hook-length control protein FliK